MYEKLTKAKFVNTGMANAVFFAPTSYFEEDGIKGPTTGSASTLENMTVISDDHVFKTGKGFIKLNCAPFKNELNASGIGEVGSMSLDQTINVNVLGNYAELHASMSLLLNEPCIVILGGVDCVDEPRTQLGTECVPTYVSSMEFTSGTLKDGQKGYAVSFNSVAGAIFSYEGDVIEKPEP